MEPAYEEPQSNQIASLMVNMLQYMPQAEKSLNLTTKARTKWQL